MSAYRPIINQNIPIPCLIGGAEDFVIKLFMTEILAMTFAGHPVEHR